MTFQSLAITHENGSDAPVGRRFSGRLHRSCESVEATCRPAGSDFEAYPAECAELAWCLHWRQCRRTWRRKHVMSIAAVFARSILPARWR